MKVDLKTNKVTRVISIPADVAKTHTYLNDVRIDNKRNFAYIADSGLGGIIIVDLGSGKAHRALDGDSSVMPDKNVKIVIDGKPVLGPTGQTPSFHSDAIALSPDGQYLYYQPMTPDRKMQTLLTDPRLEWPDTLSEGPDGSIYITASHINESPTYNKGKSTRTQPYGAFKFKPW